MEAYLGVNYYLFSVSRQPDLYTRGAKYLVISTPLLRRWRAGRILGLLAREQADIK